MPQVEDELPELSLSSASASSSDEPDKAKQRKVDIKSHKSKNTFRTHQTRTTAARQEYPEVIIKDETKEQAQFKIPSKPCSPPFDVSYLYNAVNFLQQTHINKFHS